MSDSEDLLGDDLGDQSLADYNLGNEEEEELLADDYESGGPQNVPVSMSDGYSEPVEMVPNEYQSHGMEYAPPPIHYPPPVEAECVVPNITVEVPNVPPHSYPEPRHYEPEHAVPPAIPSGPMESPQIVPSEAMTMPNGEGVRERFVAERPIGAQRMPQVRDIPDSLDKVVIPRGFPRSRTSWRAPHFNPRAAHQYRRNNMHRGNFNQRHSFPPPHQVMRPNIPQQIIRQEIRPEMVRPDIRPDMIRPEIIRPEIPPPLMRPDIIRPDLPPPDMREIRPDIHPPGVRPELPLPPQMGPEISPERPILPDMSFRPHLERPPFQPMPRFQFRPEERPMFPPRPNFERPMYPFPRQQFNPRFGQPMREIVANSAHMPQVTIRQVPEGAAGKEPEVRMLPVPLPPHLPGGLQGKKVLINPHFKGTFQPPVEGLPAYIPTRIQKSPPLSPTNKFGPIKDIDDAAERFIAEQRNALARAAQRKFTQRRSPQRYIENTTIEIENDLVGRPAARIRSEEEDLLRRQEEFINANRAGLRRRMRSPSPPSAPPVRRSPSPRRARLDRPDRNEPRSHHDDQDSEYKRRVREQESLRERVLRAKEVRRRKNAVALHKQMQDRERETLDKSQPQPPPKEREVQTPPERREPINKPEPVYKPEAVQDKPTSTEQTRPDTTRKTPDRKTPEKVTPEKPKVAPKEVKEKEKKDKSPVKAKDDEVNSTCEALTPPLAGAGRSPPWGSEEDDLDMILGDIDGILSDDEDSGRFKDKPNKAEPPKAKAVPDLRSKLPAKPAGESKPPRQKIVFEDKEETKRKEKTPPRRAIVSSTKLDDSESSAKKAKVKKTEPKAELSSTWKSRQRITFGNKEKEAEKEKEKEKLDKTPPFSNRRVILQRKTTKETKSVFNRVEPDRSQPSAGIFSRAVRIAINDKIPAKKPEPEPQIEYESDSEIDEDTLLSEDVGNVAVVDNLPHGMTDTRLKTLAGNDVQSLVLDKQERSAKITFKSTAAAETFKKKFNNKMVAASRLTVSLR